MFILVFIGFCPRCAQDEVENSPTFSTLSSLMSLFSPNKIKMGAGLVMSSLSVFLRSLSPFFFY